MTAQPLTRELLIARGAQLEATWQQMARYQEFVEDFVARFGRARYDEMVKGGQIHELIFHNYRSYFEACWYGRASWMLAVTTT